MIRRIATGAIVLGVLMVPVGTADAVQTGGASTAVTSLVPEVKAPSIPACANPRKAHDYRKDPVCLDATRDAAGRPVHEVCMSDGVATAVMPWWVGSDVICVETEHWAYLPGPGACMTVDGRQTHCVNGNHCSLSVVGARLLCEK